MRPSGWADHHLAGQAAECFQGPGCLLLACELRVQLAGTLQEGLPWILQHSFCCVAPHHTQLAGISAGRWAKRTAAQVHPEASHHTSSSLCRGSTVDSQLSSQPRTSQTPCCLQVDVPRLQRAISVACRLGFAKRLPNRNEGGGLGHASCLAFNSAAMSGCAGLCLAAGLAPRMMLSSSSSAHPATL